MIQFYRSRIQALATLYFLLFVLALLGGGHLLVGLSLAQIPLAGQVSSTLLVSSERGDRVFRFHGPLGDFVESGRGGLDTPRGLDFGPNGDVFVSNFGADNVLRYDGETGEFMGCSWWRARPGYLDPQDWPSDRMGTFISVAVAIIA